MFFFENKDNKVLILGSGGNLGGVLMREFGNEYRLSCWDREEIDITKREMVLEKIEELKPNIIINAAAYNAVDKCESDAEEFKLANMINGEAVAYIAEAALKQGAIFIHYSTDYVFGGGSLEKAQKNNGFAEDDVPNPVNKYGESKFLGEKMILEKADSGLKFYLIRISKLFGPQGTSLAAKPSFFDTMNNLSQQRDELDVVDDEMSCFTYSKDLARATREMIESKRPYGIYHVVNDGACTWYGSTLELFKILKRDIKVNPVSSDKFPRPAARPRFSVLKNTKLKKMRSYQDALRDYFEK